MTAKYGVKKLETSLSCIMRNIVRYLEPFRGVSQMWQWQTDGQTKRPLDAR